jgi:hypothetical protein
MQWAESNFLLSLEQIINNNNSLGRFVAFFTLPNYVSFQFVYNYLSPLGYVVADLSPSNSPYEFVSYFGQPGAFNGGYCDNYPYGVNDYSDFTQPFPTVISRPPRRISVSWSPFVGYQTFPYGYGPWY